VPTTFRKLAVTAAALASVALGGAAIRAHGDQRRLRRSL
jgi:hypothetical protein